MLKRFVKKWVPMVRGGKTKNPSNIVVDVREALGMVRENNVSSSTIRKTLEGELKGLRTMVDESIILMGFTQVSVFSREAQGIPHCPKEATTHISTCMYIKYPKTLNIHKITKKKRSMGLCISYPSPHYSHHPMEELGLDHCGKMFPPMRNHLLP